MNLIQKGDYDCDSLKNYGYQDRFNTVQNDAKC